MAIKLGIYQHYKGNKYKVIALGRHSETHEEMVIYQALYNSEEFGNNAVWVRPLSMWEDIKDLDGKKVKRFTFIAAA